MSGSILSPKSWNIFPRWLSVFAKTRVLGTSVRPGKYLGELVAKCFYDQADLVGHDNFVIELPGGIRFVLVLLLPLSLAGELFTFLDRLLRDEPGAIRRDLGLNRIDFVADIHAIGDGFFVAVIADDVVF